MTATSLDDLHQRWLDDPEYKDAYDALEEEWSLATALIEARTRAGLSQEEVARRMDTKQTVIARLESGRTMPSTRTLKRFADATGTTLKISFDPRHPA